MLERLLESELLKWKQQASRAPLILDGARQVGKTHLLGRIFGPKEFRRVHLLDFHREPELSGLFAGSLDPRAVIENIELRFDTKIDIGRDLVFFDEVGECQRALDSLKYFAEDLPQAFVCASGSSIGLLTSFPVGKVRHLELFPLCFEEFVMASSKQRLLQAFRERRRGVEIHRQLWSLLLDYFFVGGMPQAVTSWFAPDLGALERRENVKQTHRDLIAGYERDFGKYAGRVRAQHIHAVFSNVPRRLAASQDGSAQRFRFAGVVERKRRYKDLRGPIDWLETTKLVRKCYPIVGRPEPPLVARARENIFKLYLCDVGLLGRMLRLTYPDQRDQSIPYKGYVAENFVQTEMTARVTYPTYGWEQAHAELEFLHRSKDGRIVPVEVKSGSRTRSRSLRSYVDRYSPNRAVKLVGGPGGSGDGVIESWPLYDAQYLGSL